MNSSNALRTRDSTNASVGGGYRVFERESTLSCYCCRKSNEGPDGVASMMRCSRCKIAQYCSRDCQSKAHASHKKACARYAKLLKKQFEPSLRAYQHESNDEGIPWSDPSFAIDPYSSFLVCSPTYNAEYREYMTSLSNSKRLADPYVKTKLDLGRLAFHMAYRSCDTPERGRYGLEIALRHFLELMRFHDYGPAAMAQGISLMLLMSLGHDREATSLFRWTCNSLLFDSMDFDEVDDSLPYRALQTLCPQERDGWVFDWLMEEDPRAKQRVTETAKSMGIIIETEGKLLMETKDDHPHCMLILFILRIRRLAALRHAKQQADAFEGIAHRVLLNEKGVLALVREFVLGDGDLQKKEARLMEDVREAAATTGPYWAFLRCQAGGDDLGPMSDEFGPLLQDCVYFHPCASEVLYEFTDVD